MENFYSGVALSSIDLTWRTPTPFYKKLDAEFSFVLDACAVSESTLVADNWYGPDHSDPERRDCLVRDWFQDCGGGYIFMNPPYGRGIGKFMAKAAQESVRGCGIVALVPARTDTAWWHDYVIPFASDIRFIRGRLKFNDGPNAAPFPSAVVVYGN
jgi:site-specific DNA-methyltransferase (adenine-specific)